jgi:hypothetical protein
MKQYLRPALAVTLALAAAFGSGSSIQGQAIDYDLPERTPQQRWATAANHALSYQAALMAMGKEMGMSPEEVGDWVGKFIAEESWRGGMEAHLYAGTWYNNFMHAPGAEAELLEAESGRVVLRMNDPLASAIGLDMQHMGIPGKDFYRMRAALDAAIADYAGVTVTEEWEGEDAVVTVQADYGPMYVNDRLKYARAGFLGSGMFHRVLDAQIKEGVSAYEAGVASGRMYAPGWSSLTPWQLYRGMVWNEVAMNNWTDCEVLAATPVMVEARCSTAPVRRRVNQASAYTDLTVQDALDSGRGFAETVAEARGMRWEESNDDTHRHIRITMR